MAENGSKTKFGPARDGGETGGDERMLVGNKVGENSP
jgi:hypothetical protein